MGRLCLQRCVLSQLGSKWPFKQCRYNAGTTNLPLIYHNYGTNWIWWLIAFLQLLEVSQWNVFIIAKDRRLDEDVLFSPNSCLSYLEDLNNRCNWLCNCYTAQLTMCSSPLSHPWHTCLTSFDQAAILAPRAYLSHWMLIWSPRPRPL